MKILKIGEHDIEITFANKDEARQYSHQGDCSEDCIIGVEENRERFEALGSVEYLRSFLYPTGIGREEIDTFDFDKACRYILWIVASDAREQNLDVADGVEISATASAY